MGFGGWVEAESRRWHRIGGLDSDTAQGMECINVFGQGG